MARPIWTGAISFGLVNVPVKLFSAIHQKEVRFHMLHDKDGARIQQKRVCSAEEKEVPYEHIVKGYEVSKHRYVTVTREELEALDPKSARAIEIDEFVDLNEIDPIYWEKSYHLAPAKGAERAYSLLLHAMKDSNKVGIARFVMRSKKYLCTLRSMGEGLVISTMNYADELVPQSDIEGMDAVKGAPKEKELAMAKQLISSLSTKFDPEKYEDDYREKVLALVKRKAAGEETVTEPVDVEEPGKVINLMDALRKSLEVKGEKRIHSQAARRATRKRKAPAKRRKPPKSKARSAR